MGNAFVSHSTFLKFKLKYFAKVRVSPEFMPCNFLKLKHFNKFTQRISMTIKISENRHKFGTYSTLKKTYLIFYN